MIDIMENKTLLERFAELANARKAEIVELQHMYSLKQIENEIVQERFKEIYNKVLAENSFYSDHDCKQSRNGNKISKGDRILLSDDQWLMSKKDHNRFLEICRKENFVAGLTEEDGQKLYAPADDYIKMILPVKETVQKKENEN